MNGNGRLHNLHCGRLVVVAVVEVVIVVVVVVVVLIAVVVVLIVVVVVVAVVVRQIPMGHTGLVCFKYALLYVD